MAARSAIRQAGSVTRLLSEAQHAEIVTPPPALNPWPRSFMAHDESRAARSCRSDLSLHHDRRAHRRLQRADSGKGLRHLRAQVGMANAHSTCRCRSIQEIGTPMMTGAPCSPASHPALRVLKLSANALSSRESCRPSGLVRMLSQLLYRAPLENTQKEKFRARGTQRLQIHEPPWGRAESGQPIPSCQDLRSGQPHRKSRRQSSWKNRPRQASLLKPRRCS